MAKTYTHEFGRIVGRGNTAHRAKLNAIEGARKALDEFTYPEAVTWRGRTRFIHSIPGDGLAVAYLSEDGSIGSRVSYGHSDWASVIGGVRLDLAQLGATHAEIDDESHIPAMLRPYQALVLQWQSWAKWQRIYRSSRADGCDEECARQIASQAA
jgi:hypothetical protein